MLSSIHTRAAHSPAGASPDCDLISSVIKYNLMCCLCVCARERSRHNMHARTTARVRVAAASVPVIYCKWKRNGTRTDLFGVFDILRVLRCAGAGLEGGFDIDEFSFRVRFGAGTEQQSEKGGRVGCKLNFRKHVRWKCVFFCPLHRRHGLSAIF